MLNRLRRNSYFWLAVVLATFACAPLFYPGFVYGQSGLAAIYNLADLRQNFSLAWRPGLGLGAFFGDFTLLPYYLGVLLTSIGLADSSAVKALYATAFVLGASGTYVFVKSLFGGPLLGYQDASASDDDELSSNRAALLGGVVYTYLPYHLASTFVRADLGESFAFGLAPWAGVFLWQVARIAVGTFEPGRHKELAEGKSFALPVMAMWLILSFAAVAGLVLSSLGLGLIEAFVVAGIALTPVIRFRRLSLSLQGAAAVAVPLLIGTVLVWPLASPSSLGAAEIAASPKMVEFSRLFSPTWVEASGPLGGPPVQIGLVGVALALLTFVPAASGNEASNASRSLIRYLQIAVIASVLLMLPPFAPVWGVISRLVEEPSQFLFVVALPLSLLAGSTLLRKELAHPLAAASIVTLALLASYGYLLPEFGTVDEPSHVVAGKVGDDIVLLDYRLTPDGAASSPTGVEKGGKVHLRLIWQALGTPKEDLTVFTHALDGGQTMRGQHDSPPSNGTRPTSKWQPGDVIVDDHVLQLDPNAPAGDYVIEVGMYVPSSGQRIPISIRGQTDTRVLLPGLRVNG